MGQALKYGTTDRNGKKVYRSQSKICQVCSARCRCTANAKSQKTIERHIWQEYIEIADQIRRTDLGKETYALRSQTIERVFADAKEKHSMRYTHYRGLPKVTNWVRLKYAAMNLKKMAVWSWYRSYFSNIYAIFSLSIAKNPVLA